MELIIPKLDYPESFIAWLKIKISKYLRAVFDDSKSIQISNYINTHYKSQLDGEIINGRDIIREASKNLLYYSTEIEWIIKFNINTKLYDTQINLFDLCKIINYGNLNLNCYPIFTSTFNYFANNIDKYYNEWEEEL